MHGKFRWQGAKQDDGACTRRAHRHRGNLIRDDVEDAIVLSPQPTGCSRPESHSIEALDSVSIRKIDSVSFAALIASVPSSRNASTYCSKIRARNFSV
jgi:hypothetical protein